MLHPQKPLYPHKTLYKAECEGNKSKGYKLIKVICMKGTSIHSKPQFKMECIFLFLELGVRLSHKNFITNNSKKFV